MYKSSYTLLVNARLWNPIRAFSGWDLQRMGSPKAYRDTLITVCCDRSLLPCSEAMEWHHHEDQRTEKSPTMHDSHRLWATITSLKLLLTTWGRGGYNFVYSTRIHCPRCMPLLLAWKERLMAEAWVSVDEVA